MANKTICGSILAIALACFSGCVSVKNVNGLEPPVGAVYTDIKCTIGSPTDIPVNGDVVEVRCGSTYHFWEWLYTRIDVDLFEADVNAMAAKHGLKKVYYADYTQESIVGFFTTFEVVIYGSK